MKRVIVLSLLILLSSYVFSQDEKETKWNFFLGKGHGVEFYEEDINNMDTFIRNHGTPLKIEMNDVTTDRERESRDERILYYLYYENIIIGFVKNTDGAYHEVNWNMFCFISSKLGHYPFGAYIGMPREDFFKIFNIHDNGKDYMTFSCGLWVEIYFENQLLSKIVWSDFP